MSEKISSKGESIRGRADFIPFIPRVKATLVGGVQANPDQTFTVVTLPTEVFDTDTMHDLVTNTSRVTIKTAGVYRVKGVVTWASSAAGNRVARIYKNNVADDYETFISPAASSAGQARVDRTYECASGDYFEIAGWQNTGGNLNITDAMLEVVYIGPGFNAVRAKPVVSYVTPVQFAALTPLDGDEVYLVVDATNGVVWHMRYNAGSSSAYKWEFLGGSWIESRVLTAESITSSSGSWVDPTTVGPSIIVPRAGDYRARAIMQGSPSGGAGFVGYGTALAGAAPAEDDMAYSPTSGGYVTVPTERVLTGLSAAQELRLRYYQSGVAAFVVQKRRLFLVPVRIS